LERDRGALAAVADHGEPGRDDPDQAGRVHRRQAAYRRFAGGGRENELDDFRIDARNGVSAEVFSHAKRDREVRARGWMEAGRFDPEVVRQGGRRDERAKKHQRRDRARGRCRGPAEAHWAAMDLRRNPASLSLSRFPPERITPTREPEKSAFLWRTAAAP